MAQTTCGTNKLLVRPFALPYGVGLMARCDVVSGKLQSDVRNVDLILKVQSAVKELEPMAELLEFPNTEALSENIRGVSEWLVVVDETAAIAASSSDSFKHAFQKDVFTFITSALEKERVFYKSCCVVQSDYLLRVHMLKLKDHLKEQAANRNDELSNAEPPKKLQILDAIARGPCRIIESVQTYLPKADESGYRRLCVGSFSDAQQAGVTQFQETIAKPRGWLLTQLHMGIREIVRIFVAHATAYIALKSTKFFIFICIFNSVDASPALRGDSLKATLPCGAKMDVQLQDFDPAEWIMDALKAKVLLVWDGILVQIQCPQRCQHLAGN